MLLHLDDLASDFSAIHRITDMYALDGPTFMRLAFRMPVYEGCMRARIEHQNRQHTHTQQATSGAGEMEDLTEEQVEQLRNQARIRSNPGALREGEQPRYVSLDTLMQQST